MNPLLELLATIAQLSNEALDQSEAILEETKQMLEGLGLGNDT